MSHIKIRNHQNPLNGLKSSFCELLFPGAIFAIVTEQSAQQVGRRHKASGMLVAFTQFMLSDC
jgi:hypothetical protein